MQEVLGRHLRTSDVDLELELRTRYFQSFVRPTCRCVSCSASCFRHFSLLDFPPILRSITCIRQPQHTFRVFLSV